MRLSVFKWNVTEIGKKQPICYYGYPTKKQAQKFVEEWNANHELKIQVIKVF